MLLLKRTKLVLVVVGAVLLYAMSFLASMSSEPYTFAREFVKHDPRFTQVTGVPKAQRLLIWRGYSDDVGDQEGRASLNLRVEGTRGVFDVPMELRKQQGQWSVVRAKAITERGETVLVVE